MIASSRDVTLQKQAEEKVHKAQAELLDRQRRETELAEEKLMEAEEEISKLKDDLLKCTQANQRQEE